jgi:hypothetical protein
MYVYFAIGAALLLFGRKKENREGIPKCVEIKVITPQVEPTPLIPPVIETPAVPVVSPPPSPTDFDPLAIDPMPQPKRKGRKK